MTTDLLVVGLDLLTGRAVHPTDGSYHHWQTKGYSGDRTLVCLYCHQAGHHVPLVVKGRLGGHRRLHFAHPPGMAHTPAHAPETIWHSDGKLLLAGWARTQPNVADVRVEWRTEDHRRRADVHVTLHDGSRLALELQHQLLTDRDWLARHRDYTERDVVDVWLWHPRLDRPGILLTHGVAVHYLNVHERRCAVPLGRPHARTAGWHTSPTLEHFGLHSPPCLEDALTLRWATLEYFGLNAHGLVPPATVRAELQANAAAVRAEAAAHAARIAEIRQLGARPTPKPRAAPPAPTPTRRRAPAVPGPVPPPRRPATIPTGRAGSLGQRWICPDCGNQTRLRVCLICRPTQPGPYR